MGSENVPCVTMIKKWKIQNRKLVFHSKFVNVYKDSVTLPNGKSIPDFMLTEKSDYVIIVATDTKGRLVMQREYKHGAGEVQYALPAGLIDGKENPTEAAKRELEEETGYKGGRIKYIGTFSEYATKDMHKVHVVRISDLKTRGEQKLEDTEDIEVMLISISALKKQISKKKWHNGSALAALTLSGLLF